MSPGHDWPLSKNSAPKGPRGRGLGEGRWASFCDSPTVGTQLPQRKQEFKVKVSTPREAKKKSRLSGARFVDLKNDRLGVGYPVPPRTSENAWVPSSWHQL